ncbi:MAG: PAS domain-containing protein, partial [Bdellovibrionales bacterium]|nr:PAS domain-containing protein [Bdellovibrionales bacterium]
MSFLILLKLYVEWVIGFGTIFSKIPKRIGWMAFLWLFGFQWMALLVAGSILHSSFERTIKEFGLDLEVMTQLNQYLIFMFWGLLLVSGLLYFVFIKRFFYPIVPLIEKARGIRKGSFKKKSDIPLEENRGEWYQLDLILNKISKELKQKKADIARERTELEALVAAANDAILAVDEGQNIRYYNNPMAQLFEQKEEGNWGKSVKEVFRNQDILHAFEEVMEMRRPERVQATLLRDGVPHFFEISISPLIEKKKNRIRGAVAIFYDITEHKKVEKIRVDFVENASHELKTPVTSIQGYIDILKTKVDKSDPSTQDVFRVIDNNMSRLNSLVSDLLDLSRIESSESVKKEWMSTEEVTEGIISELRSQWQSKQQKIEVQYIAEQVFAAPSYLEQILINLIENGIKYCPPKSEIRVQWSETPGGVR